VYGLLIIDQYLLDIMFPKEISFQKWHYRFTGNVDYVVSHDPLL